MELFFVLVVIMVVVVLTIKFFKSSSSIQGPTTIVARPEFPVQSHDKPIRSGYSERPLVQNYAPAGRYNSPIIFANPSVSSDPLIVSETILLNTVSQPTYQDNSTIYDPSYDSSSISNDFVGGGGMTGGGGAGGSYNSQNDSGYDSNSNNSYDSSSSDSYDSSSSDY